MSSGSHRIGRRRFLGAATTAGLALGLGSEGRAVVPAEDDAAKGSPRAAIPAPDMAAETAVPPQMPVLTTGRSGSDFMVDVIKSLNIKYVAANPGASFRGIQESLINYGKNTAPEFLTCCHEESSVAMAHGYYKIAGQPMIAMMHGTVGVQHASMAIYNAYADRVPVILMSGNSLNANTRRSAIEWEHSVQDCASLVRDYTKWDDMPVSLQHFAESQVRAMKIALSVPGAPVMITIDSDLQEDELTPAAEARLHIPKLSLDHPPQGEDAAVQEAVALLLKAERPLIVADRYARTPNAIPLLVEFAELLQAPVLDTGNRVNFPSSHPLNQSERPELLASADVMLALEPVDLWGLTHSVRDISGRPWRSFAQKDVKIITIGTGSMLIKANFQDFQRYGSADIAISADAEATMPSLTERLRRKTGAAHRSRNAQRRKALESAHRATRRRTLDEAAIAWDLSPVHPARVAMELWDQIKHDDWSLVGFPSIWARRLWPMDKYYSHTGGTGAAGLGYGLPAAVGSALANRDHGRLSINIQPDGDFLVAPSALWTAAHHRVPLLTVMFNNRGYIQEFMHAQRMANRHDRGVENAGIGTTLRNPDIDFAKMAQSMGVYAEGPIVDPNQLRDAIRRALEVVRRDEPALIDVVSQPR